MNWTDASEIVVGLILNDRLSCKAVRAELLFPPYDKIIKYKQNGTLSIEEIIEKVGLSPVQSCLEAVKSMNGLGSSDWIGILENSALAYDAGTRLEKISRRLIHGEEIDWSQLSDISSRVQQNQGGSFTPLSEITSKEVPFKETGWLAIDKHLGGIPEIGQVIIAGPPGIGKTTTATSLAGKWVQKWEKDNVIIFTLEMLMEEFAMRFREINRLSKEQEARIQINDFPVSPEEVISKAACMDNRGLVIVDFADLLIRGETTESAMSHIYRTFMLGAKSLRCPVILLSQLNRQYKGGIPRPYHIRYTGLAEALAYMILMIYNPNLDYFGEESNEKCGNVLEIKENHAYLIAWKVRGGFRKHPDNSPGAIQIPFKGKIGWHTNHKGYWFSLQSIS